MDKRSKCKMETLKLLQENIEDIGRSNDFLNRIPIAKEMSVRIDKLKFLHIKRNSYQDQESSHMMGFRWFLLWPCPE
jgi:hypothetical protein